MQLIKNKLYICIINNKQKEKIMTAQFEVTGTEMTILGLVKKYQVKRYFNSGAVISDSDKRITSAFKIIFEMKDATRIQKIKAVNKVVDLSNEEWNTIFSRYENHLQ